MSIVRRIDRRSLFYGIVIGVVLTVTIGVLLPELAGYQINPYPEPDPDAVPI